MNQLNERELQQYFKQVRLLLPLFTKTERQFIKDLQTAVEDFRQTHPDCSMDDIYERFEEPQEIVSNYLASIDTDQLCRKISLRRYIKRAIAVIVAIVVLSFCVYCGMIYKVYLDAQNQIVTQEVTVIE